MTGTRSGTLIGRRRRKRRQGKRCRTRGSTGREKDSRRTTSEATFATSDIMSHSIQKMTPMVRKTPSSS